MPGAPDVAAWVRGVAALVLLTGCAGGAPPLPPDVTADRILVEKSARRLTLLRGGMPLKAYRVALSRAPVGDKVREGDHRVPEGTFSIDGRLERSRFHRALHISYPDSTHDARARALGVSPGGDIMVHGILNGLGWVGSLHRVLDWTAGCIAVTNAEIEEIWRVVPDGTPIEIRP